jgi:hypothetical protein
VTKVKEGATLPERWLKSYSSCETIKKRFLNTYFFDPIKKRSKKDDPDSIGKLMYGKFAATKSNIR